MLKWTQNSSLHKVTELFFTIDVTSYLRILFLPAWNCSVWHIEVQAAWIQDDKCTDLNTAEWLLGPRSHLTQRTSLLGREPAGKEHQEGWWNGGRNLLLLWDCRARPLMLALSPLTFSHSWWPLPHYWFCMLTQGWGSICWHCPSSFKELSMIFDCTMVTVSCSVWLVFFLLEVASDYGGEYYSGFPLTDSLSGYKWNIWKNSLC